MPKLPTTPTSFEAPVAASQARSKAQEIVDANRSKAEKLFASRTAKKSLIQLLAKADRELSAHLDDMKRLGPSYRPWTQADTEATLAIVREQLGQMAPGFRSLLNANAERAREIGAKGTVQLLEHFEQAQPGTIRPLSLEGASQLLSGTVLSRHASSVARYGQITIASIQRELAVGTLINRTFDEMATRLQREQPLLSRRYFAERVVRTECMNAYNGGHLDEIVAQRAGNFPDLEKKLIETFDKRTGQDSYKAHGQVKKPEEMFVDGNGRQYLHPPGRPNDRGVVVPWRREWESKKRSAAVVPPVPEKSAQPVPVEVAPVAAIDTKKAGFLLADPGKVFADLPLATRARDFVHHADEVPPQNAFFSAVRLTSKSVPSALVDSIAAQLKAPTPADQKPVFVQVGKLLYPADEHSNAWVVAHHRVYPKQVSFSAPVVSKDVLVAMAEKPRIYTPAEIGAQFKAGVDDPVAHRAFLRSLVAEPGSNAVSYDVKYRRAGLNESAAEDMGKSRAVAYHDWTGEIVYDNQTLIRQKNAGLELKRGVKFQSLTEQHKHAINTAFHEELHGMSPMLKSAFTEHGRVLEEVSTELLSRRALRRVFGLPSSLQDYVGSRPYQENGIWYGLGGGYAPTIEHFFSKLSATGIPQENLVARVEQAFLKLRAGDYSKSRPPITSAEQYAKEFVAHFGADLTDSQRDSVLKAVREMRLQ